MYPERVQRCAALFLLLIAFWLAIDVSAAHRHRSRRDLEHRKHLSHVNSHTDQPYAFPAGSGESSHINAPMWRYPGMTKLPDEFSTIGDNLNALKNSIPRVRDSFNQFLREMKNFVFQMDVVFGIPIKSPSMPLSIPYATNFRHTTTSTTTTLCLSTSAADQPSPSRSLSSESSLSGQRSTSTTIVHTTFMVTHSHPATGPGAVNSQSTSTSQSRLSKSVETQTTTSTSRPSVTPTNLAPLDLSVKASDNVVVYYGGSAKTPLDTSKGLLDICKQPSISIINLAFITGASPQDSYPIFSFGAACSATDKPSTDTHLSTPALQGCAALGKQIQACQRMYGKKIFLSLGGATGTLSFSSAAKARQFADALWDAFGAPQASNVSTPAISKRVKLPRPFGQGVVVDGFDIDNESHSTEHWIDFAQQLKAYFTSAGAIATGKTFYLSSAPQCPFPDQSIPLDVLALSDLINVQFYNNDPCDLANGTSGFLASIVQWAQNLRVSAAPPVTSSPSASAPSSLPNATTSASTHTSAYPSANQDRRKRHLQSLAQLSRRRPSSQPAKSPKLLIGLPAWTDGGSGFVPANNLTSVVHEARAHLRRAGLVDMLGGIMLWDGSAALENSEDGIDYLTSVAKALAE